MGNAKALMSLVKNNPDPMVRMLALNGLVNNADDAVTLVMVEALKDRDAQVRQSAIAGLGLVARKVVPGEILALVKCLEDKDQMVLLQAAAILYDQPGGAEAAMPELKKLLKSRNADLRNAAVEAFREFNLQSKLAEQYAKSQKTNTIPILDISTNEAPVSAPMSPHEMLGIFINTLSDSEQRRIRREFNLPP